MRTSCAARLNADPFVAVGARMNSCGLNSQGALRHISSSPEPIWNPQTPVEGLNEQKNTRPELHSKNSFTLGSQFGYLGAGFEDELDMLHPVTAKNPQLSLFGPRPLYF